MNDTYVTLQGWLGTEPVLRQVGEAVVTEFRVACTPRKRQFNAGSPGEEWVDEDTQWYTVKAWRGLAENCHGSLHRGDPVVVHGRQTAQTWTNSAGIAVTSFEVVASLIGHDLSRGTSAFTKTTRAGSDAAADQAPTEVVAA